MTFFTTPELLEIGDIPMTSMYEKPTRTEALKYYRRVADHYKLNIHQYEHVESIGGQDGTVPDTDDGSARRQTYPPGPKVILSTGYYDVPNLLNVPGEDLPKVIHYYKEAHPYYNHDVMVVGAKNSAAIAALELFWTGARVTLVHRGTGNSQSREILDQTQHRKPHQERRSQSYFESQITEIRPGAVTIATPDGPVDLKNDFVFAMIGYSPDLKFLNATGISLRSRNATAAHRPANFGERTQRCLPRRRYRGRNAHQRDFHREWALPRSADRSRYCECFLMMYKP